MKLTKKQQKELLQGYETYWAEYLNGNVDAMEVLLDDSYTQVGSAESEVFTTKKEAIQFLRDTIQEVAGKLQMRNRSTKLESQEAVVLVHERCDLYARTGAKWVFYSKFRATTFLQERKDGWRIIHQHSSFPDTKTGKGQNIAIDKIAEENQELRDAIKRRTIELEQKNRELEIEASVERVRSKAMAMQNSDELSELVDTVFKELTKLDLALSWCMINIIDEPSMSNIVWGANPEIGKAPESYHMLFEDYRFHHEMFKAWKEKKDKWVFVLKGAEKEIYDAYLFNETEFRRVPEAVQKEMRATKQYVASFTFSNFGGIQTVGEEPLSDESLNILGRFGKVFDLTYTRFNDLKQAEAQAREAQIETALERVRSRTMGMQKSEELKEVIQVVYEQFVHLNFQIEHTGFIIDYKTSDDMNIWLADQQEIQTQITLPYFDCAHWNSFKEAKEKGLDFFANHLDFEEKNRFYQDLFKLVQGLSEEAKEYYFSASGLAISTVLLDNIGLYIENFSGIPYTDEENNTLMRFGKVFQQSYTRFLDLQKAETQAREAQIESALERVRSKTMAMHNSQDVGDTVVTFFYEVMKLGLDKSLRCGLGILEGTERMETWSANYSPNGNIDLKMGMLNMTIHPMLVGLKKAWKSKKAGYTYDFIGKDVTDYYKALNNEPEYPFNVDLNTLPEKVFHNSFFFSSGILFAFTENPISEEAANVLNRLANVFGQTYRRYLDLQKAEEQVREAQIEAGLERVRASAMAMRSSDDLLEVANVLRDQMANLGQAALESSIIHLYEEDKDKILVWYSYRNPNSPDDKIISDEARVDKKSTAYIRETIAKYKSGETEYTIIAKGEMLREWYKELESLDVNVIDYDENGAIVIPEVLYYHYSNFSGGSLLMISNDPPSKESGELQKRAAGVFDMAYRRFSDLKKTEEQAREAQVEAALERVRASSMAMHKSEQLPETSQVLFEQFALLGNIPDRISICVIKEEENLIELWATDQIGSHLDHRYSGSLEEATTMSKFHKAWKEGKDSIVIDLLGQNLKDWLRYIKEDVKLPIDDTNIKGRRVQQAAFFSKGLLLCTTNEPVADEIMHLLIRFAKVFNQTYTRFLDLQKAEAQAREAQIEAALEKVRSSTMAMHRSEELTQVGDVLFRQIQELGNTSLRRCVICIFNEQASSIEIWYTSEEGNSETKGIIIPTTGNDVAKWLTKTWKEKRTDSLELEGAKLKDFVAFLVQYGWIYPKGEKPPDSMVLSVCPFSNGSLMPVTYEPLNKSDFDLLQRFASVFQQTYTRFLDLKKAEMQAREAQIEAALEKVRGKAMAMHHSNDLVATAGVVFSELKNLGINTFRSGVGLLNKENRDVELYGATSSEDGMGLSLVGKTILKDHPVLSQIYTHWINNEDYYPTLKGDLLSQYYEQIGGQYKVPASHIDSAKQYGYFLPFSEGVFYGWSHEPFTDAEIAIMQRFNGIMDLTFRRYIELQKAEANALDANRRSSVDRVRAEIASMRTTGDLERITPIIWNELTTLDVPFVRCGVFIFDEQEEQIHTFLSKPDGKAIAAFHLSYDSSPFVDAIENWRSKKIHIIHWDNEGFSDLADTLVKEGQIATRQQYLSTVPKDGLYLHYVPFLQGILYVGNSTELDKDSLRLVQSIADAFSTAYARYEDFNKLEEAKQQVEKTLTDLKQTQQQLVQSEKMASLGELTAGIAHEIQNPLNFVNNFSEVSVELIEEMYEELKNGDLKEAMAIAEDVKQNLDKITHHGKRADGIVKGMLQHSRSSSGQKEPTDINVLADEYLRLAYHGLRAKDKSFNATMKSEFDESIGQINIVPQDIGRVVLNLITNAFYACAERSRSATDEKKKLNQTAYEPTVEVTTKKEGNQVLISVKDNGNGIPKKVLDKIFQPFFTTKPTGQGTGLGLSLSYDIVKAHGGELNVKTKENKGTEFTIILPA
ncbi:MAG: ATP-binding protein [Eudoraea sp.]|uniref:ATP-binding protein n=1 Tax=Eudoraea sp. TaxID=1979955 RepID=UPI003C71F696